MCLFQVQHKLTSLHIPFYCFKGSFDRSLNVPVSPGCLVQRIFEDCICVSLFSYQGSCRSFLATAFILYQSCFCLSRTFLTFFKVFYQLLSFSATAVLEYHIFIRLSRTFSTFLLFRSLFRQLCKFIIFQITCQQYFLFSNN